MLEADRYALQQNNFSTQQRQAEFREKFIRENEALKEMKQKKINDEVIKNFFSHSSPSEK
jgi:hypothetical protein